MGVLMQIRYLPTHLRSGLESLARVTIGDGPAIVSDVCLD